MLLDRGWGKAPQPHTGEDNRDVRVTISTAIRIDIGVRLQRLAPAAVQRHYGGISADRRMPRAA